MDLRDVQHPHEVDDLLSHHLAGDDERESRRMGITNVAPD